MNQRKIGSKIKFLGVLQHIQEFKWKRFKKKKKINPRWSFPILRWWLKLTNRHNVHLPKKKTVRSCSYWEYRDVQQTTDLISSRCMNLQESEGNDHTLYILFVQYLTRICPFLFSRKIGQLKSLILG